MHLHSVLAVGPLCGHLDRPLRRRAGVAAGDCRRADGIFAAYKGMLPQGAACLVVAYIIKACIVMACILMAGVVMAYIVRPMVRPMAMAYIWPI